MNSVAGMNAEAARCFRRACESGDALDQTIFIGLRQAWLALAQQVEQLTSERQPLTVPAGVADNTATHGAKDRPRLSQARRHKAGGERKSPSRTRRKTLAA